MIEQRSTEWQKQRSGKFTASQIHRLLGKESLKMTKNSIANYAMEKAGEQFFGISEEETFTSFDMQRGIDLEPVAFIKFSEIKANDFIEVFESPFVEIDENSGASPDGKLSDGSNLEIKCPKIETFNKLVLTGEIDKKYMAQMQMQMLATGANHTHFFNYVIHTGKEFYHTIIVDRDEEMMTLIKERVIIASELKNEYLEILKEKMI